MNLALSITDRRTLRRLASFREVECAAFGLPSPVGLKVIFATTDVLHKKGPGSLRGPRLPSAGG